MRLVNPPQFRFAHLRAALLLPAVGLVLSGAPHWLSAQAPADQTPAPESTPKPVHIRKRPSPAHPASATQAPGVQAHMVAPKLEKPKWPAFDQPAQASVVWDSHGLSIDATNSSLQQILKDVSTATGVKIDGVTSDQRVFGAYGPGQARQSTAVSTPQKPNQANNDEDNAEDPEPPEPEQPVRPAFPPGVPPRTPQQIMQEMHDRQQQIQQNQQNQQQQPNQPQPPGQPQQPN